MTFDEIEQRFADRITKRANDSFQAKCPAHDDHQASLTVSKGQGGRTLVHCHANCDTGKILDAMGLKPSDLFTNGNNGNGYHSDPVVATYEYENAAGNVIYRVERKQSKKFVQSRPDPASPGKWIYNLSGVQRVLYRLPDLLAAPTDAWILIAEGEKDANNLRKLGFIATTNAGGAGKWSTDYSKSLSGRKVIILPDNDAPGRQHAQLVGAELVNYASEVRVLELPNLPAKGDASDWIAAGGQALDLIRLIEGAPAFAVWSNPAPTTQTTAPTAKLNYLLTYPTDDEGVAECVETRYPGRFLYTESHGWLQYVGTHYEMNGAESAVERAITETLQARIEAALVAGAQNFSDLIKKSARNSRGVKAAKAQLLSRVYASIDTFDSDPDLLNCANGVLDLRSGQLVPHDPNQRFMHCVPISYNHNADYVEWVEWLSGATSVESAEWLQMAIGYSLTGYTREEILFYLYGPPRSGKGTLTEVLLALLNAPLAKEVNFGTFTAQRAGDSQNFDLAPLKPCRLVAASESNAYERFNEAKIKSLTGGNEVYCAFKHQTHFAYKPQYKIWLSSNQPVNADPDDDAVWGRVRVIEFPHSHLGSEDKTLKARMKSPAMLESVLCWAVAGAALWYKLGSAGLPELAALSALKAAQRSELDHVQQWLDECCDVTNPSAFSSNESVNASYSQWCKDNGAAPKQKKKLTQSLSRKGFLSTSQRITILATGSSKVARGFAGLRIA